MERQNAAILVYVGTYTRGGSEGIYVFRLDASSGALEPVGKPASTDNPTFLAIHPSQSYLYAANEIGEFAGKPGGAVTAFSICPHSGELVFLNQQPSVGAGPCHLSIDATGQHALVANYGGGSVTVLPIRSNGHLGEPTDFIQHAGASVDPGRQAGPHAHSINLDPANRYAFAADLGLDRILVYKLNHTEGKLLPHDPPWTQVRPGAGPRHFAFHPNGKYAYLINELDNTFIAYAYDQSRAVLTELQTITTLPDDFKDTSYCADLHISSCGRFLYGSNRGHDSIAVFSINAATGKLTCIGHESTQGGNPRNFAIDPTGAFLLAANQDTDTLVTFRINRQSGGLSPTGQVTTVPKPVCIKMIQAAQC